MNDATQPLATTTLGDQRAAAQFLPLVYDELLRLAAARLACERHEHTLQPTALVHEAWIKLAGPRECSWQGRRHFFAAAAEAIKETYEPSQLFHVRPRTVRNPTCGGSGA